MKRITSFLMSALFCTALLMAPTLAKAEKILYVANDTNELGVTTFNPIKVELSHEAMNVIYDRLIEWGSDGKFYPGLAESWNISKDGLTWKMTLKKGVKFQDGSPFNAEVVKWFLNEMKTGPSAYMVGAIDHTDIVDDYHVIIYFKHPEPNMFFNFSQNFMSVPSMVAYKKYGPEDFGIKHVVGSGPYIFKSWSPGNKLVLEKNPDYTWGPGYVKNKGPAKIDEIVFRDIKEDSTRFLELKTGKMDVLYSVPTMFISKIEADKNLSIVRMPGRVLYHMVMNTQAQPLDNLLVRKGIALAIHQKSITHSVFADAGNPAYTYLLDSLPASHVPEDAKIKYDPEAANAALDEAGWKMGPDNIRVKDGKQLKLKLLAKNESSYRRCAEVIQAQLAKVGVDAKITLMDASSIRAYYRKGEHQLAVRSYDWENADILEWFFNSTRLGYPNAAMWHDNESDYLMQKAMAHSRTAEERIANFKDYHTYLLRHYLWAPIYLPDAVFALGKRVVRPADCLDRHMVGPSMVDWDLE